MGRSKKSKQNADDRRQLSIPRGIGTRAVGRPLQARRNLHYQSTLTAATGVVLALQVDSALATSAYEWTNFASIFQEWRCRAVKLTWMPRTGTQIVNAASFAVPAPNRVGCAYSAATSAPSLAGIIAGQGSRYFRPHDTAVVTCSHELNPSSDLWSATTGAPSLLMILGVVISGLSVETALTNGIVFDWIAEFDCEFRSAL